MEKEVDLQEVSPGVYAIRPKREPVFQPGLGLKIICFAGFLWVAQLAAGIVVPIVKATVDGAFSVLERSLASATATQGNSQRPVLYRQR